MRPIRSFVRREGRMTERQKRALEQLWSQYGLEPKGEINFIEVFKRDCPRILEIVFGNGESLLQQTQANPDYDFIGIEVYRPGIGMLLAKCAEAGIKNLRVLMEDAVAVFKNNVPNQSLQKIQIFFPDPWPKKRHYKRRLIQPEFIKLLTPKLQCNGILHLATDWQPYAEHMQTVMQSQTQFLEITDTVFGKQEKNARCNTKFARRGQRLGHQEFDWVYQRTGREISDENKD